MYIYIPNHNLYYGRELELDGLLQLSHIERLGEHHVCALAGEVLYLVVEGVAGDSEYEPGVSRRADGSRGLRSRQVGHVIVHQDDVVGVR